jgi:Uncharacterized conserved protein related to C-terminal domain of eukaryotic chaperone, SACSIN
MRQETDLWLRQAQEDLITAQVNFNGGRFYAASIFSQQAAEKALKALILERTGATPPRTHDLIALGHRIGASLDIAEALEQLNPTYAVSRYPDVLTNIIPADFINEEAAKSHMAAAELILRWAKKKAETQF